uniref:Uncharacterized protein n=1 Tax=Oryza brachyantha TaxID=4533 RepID=J3M5C4_ORYBR
MRRCSSSSSRRRLGGQLLWLLLLCSSWRMAASQPQPPPTTDPTEAAALNKMMARWGIKATPEWNISGELCSGVATDASPSEDYPKDPAIKCDCYFNKNTICHIIKLIRPYGPHVNPIQELYFLLGRNGKEFDPASRVTRKNGNRHTGSPFVPPLANPDSLVFAGRFPELLTEYLLEQYFPHILYCQDGYVK